MGPNKSTLISLLFGFKSLERTFLLSSLVEPNENQGMILEVVDFREHILVVGNEKVLCLQEVRTE